MGLLDVFKKKEEKQEGEVISTPQAVVSEENLVMQQSGIAPQQVQQQVQMPTPVAEQPQVSPVQPVQAYPENAAITTNSGLLENNPFMEAPTPVVETPVEPEMPTLDIFTAPPVEASPSPIDVNQTVIATAAVVDTPQPGLKEPATINVNPTEMFTGGETKEDTITQIVSNAVNENVVIEQPQPELAPEMPMQEPMIQITNTPVETTLFSEPVENASNSTPSVEQMSIPVVEQAPLPTQEQIPEIPITVTPPTNQVVEQPATSQPIPVQVEQTVIQQPVVETPPQEVVPQNIEMPAEQYVVEQPIMIQQEPPATIQPTIEPPINMPIQQQPMDALVQPIMQPQPQSIVEPTSVPNIETPAPLVEQQSMVQPISVPVEQPIIQQPVEIQQASPTIEPVIEQPNSKEQQTSPFESRIITRFCDTCGEMILDNRTTCPNCGAPLN